MMKLICKMMKLINNMTKLTKKWYIYINFVLSLSKYAGSEGSKAVSKYTGFKNENGPQQTFSHELSINVIVQIF